MFQRLINSPHLAALIFGTAGMVAPPPRFTKSATAPRLPKARGGRNIESASLRPGCSSTLRKLARHARRGEITLPTAGKCVHDWQRRPKAAKS